MATQAVNTFRFVDLIRNQYDPDIVTKTGTQTSIKTGESEANILYKLYNFLITNEKGKDKEFKSQIKRG